MKEFKGTKGEWKVSEIGTNELFINSINGFHPICTLKKKYGDNGILSIQQAEANAQLIADAGTTINKCGLLPSELLKQRDDLLEALQGLLNNHVELVSCGDCGNWEVEEENEVIEARKAINKALGL